MDTLVEDTDILFPQVFAHLAAVESQPDSVLLDDELLKRAERSFDRSTPKSLFWRLLGTGQSLLEHIQQDPRPLTRLMEEIITWLPFDELKTTISVEKLEQGLNSPSAPVQLLCLAYLRSASDRPSGVVFVAASSSLVQCLFTTWLSSESTEVAERSLEVIHRLLGADSKARIVFVDSPDGPRTQARGQAQGRGLLWRRVFTDPDVYSILFTWTSPLGSKRDVNTMQGMQLLTISQARLFDFIARIAPYDWPTLSTSTLPAVEARYMPENEDSQPLGGLLRYAASYMIETTDILLHVLRQDFFWRLLGPTGRDLTGEMPPGLLEALQQLAGPEGSEDEEDVGTHL